MKPMLNLHAHTTRCRHAVGTEREYVERAIAAGYRTFGFSDHAPMPFQGEYYSGFRMKQEETGEYIKTLLDLREEYKNDIHILIGFEAEYYPALFEDFLRLIAPYPVDYLLLGQHFLDNEEGAYHTGAFTDDESLLEKYVLQVTEGLKTGMFTYLAHPDIMRYVGDARVYEKHMRVLCQNAKAMDIPLEINGLGLWDGRDYPSERFFRIAGEVGNRVIFGLDAHQAERIGEVEIAEQAAELAGRFGLELTEEVVLRRPRPL